MDIARESEWPDAASIHPLLLAVSGGTNVNRIWAEKEHLGPAQYVPYF